MCLRVDKTKPEVADSEIVCYKVLVENNGNCRSPFYEFEYEIGKKYSDKREQVLEPCDDSPFWDCVYYGFHSYESYGDVNRLMELLYSNGEFIAELKNGGRFVVVKCIIPNGARYYRGQVDTGFLEEVSPDGSMPPGFVSDAIIIKEIL